MNLVFLPMPTEVARAYQHGGPDAYGNASERFVSDGDGNPCRHCLSMIEAGEPALVLAHRPFARIHPYAETGPVFLHARECDPGGGPEVPSILSSPDYILRGYDAGERIVYGTGQIVPTTQILDCVLSLLRRDEIAFVDLRSARNNCFQCRAVRG